MDVERRLKVLVKGCEASLPQRIDDAPERGFSDGSLPCDADGLIPVHGRYGCDLNVFEELECV